MKSDVSNDSGLLPKVFGIGLNKTGTSSLGDALNLLAIKSSGVTQLAGSKIAEDRFYSADYYNKIRQGSRRSAQVIVPLVCDLVRPKSVVDVGCGTGEWLTTFAQLDVGDYLGVDAEQLDSALLRIPIDRFLAHDLCQPLNLSRKFDLAISLEVAEHLPEDCAETFVES